ncbi:hypothetical protein MKX03_010319 [Papaver bracteatum]|nr:hypothetical protein MKX03_010319 [Papaver bracteatum]
MPVQEACLYQNLRALLLLKSNPLAIGPSLISSIVSSINPSFMRRDKEKTKLPELASSSLAQKQPTGDRALIDFVDRALRRSKIALHELYEAAQGIKFPFKFSDSLGDDHVMLFRDYCGERICATVRHEVLPSLQISFPPDLKEANFEEVEAGSFEKRRYW